MKTKVDVRGRPLPCELYFDGYLWKNMEAMNTLIDKKFDNVGLICGYSGDGKSELAMQIALGLDATFNLDRVVFDAEDFERVVDSAPKGSVIVWDEADQLVGAGHWGMVRTITRKMKRIRFKNLHILWVTPSPFDLSKYFIIDRTRWLVHVYSKDFNRGFFRFFDRDNKKKLYIEGRKQWDWNCAKPNFFGRYTKWPKGFPIETKAYEEKKGNATEDMMTEKDKVRKNRTDSQVKSSLKKVLKNLDIYLSQEHSTRLSQKKMGQLLGRAHNTIGEWRFEIESEILSKIEDVSQISNQVNGNTYNVPAKTKSFRQNEETLVIEGVQL